MPTKTHTIRYTYRYVANDIFNGRVYTQLRANTFSGVAVPGWRDKIRNGRQAGSPYTVDAVRIDRLVSSTYHRVDYAIKQNPTGPIVGKGSVVVDGVIGALDLANTISEVGSWTPAQAEAQALNRLYEKLRSQYESAAGMQFLGEMRETVRLIRRPGEALTKLVKHKVDAINQASSRARQLRRRRGESDKDFRRRKAKALYQGTWYERGAPYSDALSGTVLEWNFAVKPLLSEVQDLAKAAAEAIHGYEPSRVRLSATSDPFVASFSNGDPSTGYTDGRAGINCRELVSRVTTRSVKYMVGVDPRVSAPVGSLGLLAERSGFGLNNFVPTLYELMPWSFLIDYFLNLGQVLNAAFTSTANVAWVVRTERIHTVGKQVKHGIQGVSLDPQLYPLLQVISNNTTAGRLETTRTRLTRTIPQTLPLPPLVLSLPGMGGNQWINMAALLLQTRRSIHQLLS